MNKYKYNLNTFYNLDALSYYLLGVYMTDGNIWVSKANPKTKMVRLCSKDLDWLSLIRDSVCNELPIKQKKWSLGNNNLFISVG